MKARTLRQVAGLYVKIIEVENGAVLYDVGGSTLGLSDVELTDLQSVLAAYLAMPRDTTKDVV